MRKCVILLLLLSFLSLGGILYAHRAVDELSDQVSFTEGAHSGELSAAEGLEVTLKTQMERNLFWETTYPLGGEPTTDFVFSQEGKYTSFLSIPYGISIDFPTGYGWSSSRGTNYENPSEEDIERMGSDYVLLPILQAVSQNTAPNSEHTELVRVADYFEYLPLSFYLDDEAVFYVVEEGGYENAYSVMDLYDAASSHFSTALNDYFRIPTPEDMLLEIGMYKDSAGLITELNINSAFEEAGGVSPPGFEVYSAVTEQGCYFTFSGRCYDVDGNRYPLDTSHIEGGPGVYFLPYTGDYDLVQTNREEGVKYVDLEGFGSVYAFESEDVIPEDLHVLEDGQTMLLTTREGQTLYLSVIDLATGERVQKLYLMELGDEPGWGLRTVWYEGGFLLHLSYDERFALSQLTETGYEVRITGELDMDNSLDSALYAEQVALAYDGEKLGIAFSVYRTEPYYDNASSIGVMVYDQSGQLYAGVHINSLDTGSEEYSQRVTLSGSEAIAVRWE